jgi:radical SAM superfamily enzyme YgiQ (UPF0313 family)
MPTIELSKIIEDFKPDIIACSVCSTENRCLHEVASLAKKLSKDCKLVVGGPHPTMYFQDILKDSNIDIAVIGEGEFTFCDLLEYFEKGIDISKIDGIAFMRNGKLIVTKQRGAIEDLDSLPFPAWDLIDIDKYSKVKMISMNAILAGQKYMGIFTSRGCPYQCIYCHNIFGKQYRSRSPKNVFFEIMELYNRYGVDEFHIFDDVFNLDADRAKKICDLILSSKLDIKIAFPNGLRGDIMDEELISKLKASGTYAITYALETASIRLQKMLRKNIDIQKLKRTIEFSDKQGLLTKCYFMIGFPTETAEEIKQTINFACNSALSFSSFFIVTPQRRTELYSLIKQYYPSFEMNFDGYHYYAENTEYEKIIKLPLKEIQKGAYRKFYLSPKRLIKIFYRIPRKIYLLRLMPIFFLNIYEWRRKININFLNKIFNLK